MNLKSALTFLAAGMMLAGDYPSRGGNRGQYNAVPTNPDKVCPKGCKTYFFNSNGEFSTVKMLKEVCVFICFALNDKSATKKFNKFKTQTK